MGRHNGNGKLSKKIEKFPQITIDRENDFASIKIAKGVEHKSYEKEGFIFCEDKSGRVIEIQVLNLSKLPDLLATAS
ncbi:MAG: hypothetical protein JNM39_12430 [Bdellovibrionaceae bacterium]|nr:hypothetical protein [Pseudobdellovibrionaceae bacterium]